MTDETRTSNPEDGSLTIMFGDQTYRGNYLEDLKVDESNFDEMLITQPSRYVFWSKMTAMARAMVERKKLELDRYNGQLFTFKRREGLNQGTKPTEASLKAEITQDERMKTLQDELIRVRLKYDHLTSIKEAFSQRVQMLMSYGANRRAEITNLELSVKEKEELIQQRRA